MKIPYRLESGIGEPTERRRILAPVKYLLIVVLGMAFLPVSGATQSYLSLAGIRFYEILFLVFVVLSPFVLLDRRYFKLCFIITMIIAGILLHSMILGQSVFNSVNSIRDLLWYCIGIFVGKAVCELCTHENLSRLYIYLLGFYCVYLLLGYTVAAPIFAGHIEDAHAASQFDEDDWFMRVGFSSQILLIFLLVYLLSYAKLHRNTLAMLAYTLSMLLPVLCGGSRSMIGIFAIIVLWVLVKRFTLAFLLFVVVSLMILSIGPDAGRFSFDGVVYGWIGRNGPFLSAIMEFNLPDWCYGKGFGQMFEIPWFEKTAFDTMARNVDGLYQTLIVKVGIVGTLAFVGWHFYIRNLLGKVPGVLPYSLGMILVVELLLGLTNTYLFQLTAVFYGLPVGLALAVIRRRRMLHQSNPSSLGFRLQSLRVSQ
ncbi:MAG: DUF6369 family protein [Sideroxyarcus sp.]|nr:DUF6369 family protein [Sideroxyarcus sp.]